MSLNLKTKIQGLECPWICKEVLECPWILLALVFGYFLKLFDIQDGHFVELILHVHIWPRYKVTFWTIQRHILLISNAFSSVFSPWISWYMALNVLEKSLTWLERQWLLPCTCAGTNSVLNVYTIRFIKYRFLKSMFRLRDKYTNNRLQRFFVPSVQSCFMPILLRHMILRI